MAYVKKTLADLKQSLADRHDSGTLPTASATIAFWRRLLNRGQVYCTDKLRLEKEITLTTVSGVIDLPDDFIMILRIFDGDRNETFQVDKDSEVTQVGNKYWITGNQFDGFVLNTPSDTEYTVHYAFRPAEMTNENDVCIIPDPEAVVAYAYSMLRRSETDPIGDADLSMQECIDRLAEVQSVDNINDKFEGLTIS